MIPFTEPPPGQQQQIKLLLQKKPFMCMVQIDKGYCKILIISPNVYKPWGIYEPTFEMENSFHI